MHEAPAATTRVIPRTLSCDTTQNIRPLAGSHPVWRNPATWMRRKTEFRRSFRRFFYSCFYSCFHSCVDSCLDSNRAGSINHLVSTRANNSAPVAAAVAVTAAVGSATGANGAATALAQRRTSISLNNKCCHRPCLSPPLISIPPASVRQCYQLLVYHTPSWGCDLHAATRVTQDRYRTR